MENDPSFSQLAPLPIHLQQIVAFLAPLSSNELELMGLFRCMSDAHISAIGLPGNGAYRRKWP